ncbi:MAG: hypothetical protein OEN52_08215 [Gammaproteobacteria bacterium]|nr:hypothetical protein [Gammaproteobacteria bacterium]MDH3560921.1 hypothetical protein [Gammaproteobacteria bacterium]
MSDKPVIKPLAIAVGTAIVTSLASVNVATAAENPFAMTELSSGYMVAEMAEGKCGEGKCGGAAKTMKEGKCGEGKCGMKSMDADADGSITEDEFMKGHEAMFNKMDANDDGLLDADEQSTGMKMMKEGKCGEGKCGGAKATGEAKTMKEGKCGEGKCGANQ